MRWVGAACLVIVLGTSCGADRTSSLAIDEPAADPTVASIQPTPLPPTSSPTTGPAPTPTPRIIQLPGTPSERALVCAQAGLVAAGFDACLVYMGNDCTLEDTSPTCESARAQLDVVMRSRIFPTDCADLPDEATDVPAWCELNEADG